MSKTHCDPIKGSIKFFRNEAIHTMHPQKSLQLATQPFHKQTRQKQQRRASKRTPNTHKQILFRSKYCRIFQYTGPDDLIELEQIDAKYQRGNPPGPCSFHRDPRKEHYQQNAV